LAARGEDGVVDVLRILRTELARTMTLMGVHKLNDLGPEWLVGTGGGR